MAIEMIWTPADGAGPGGQLHATEFGNVLRAVNGGGIIGNSVTVTPTGTTLVVTIAAFKAMVPNGSGTNVFVDYAGGTVTVTTGHGTLPRTDICQINSSGTVSMKDGTPTAETGDVVEAPMAAIDANAIALFKVKMGIAGTAVTDAITKGRAIDISKQLATLSDVTQLFVEQGTRKGYAMSGPPGYTAYATGTRVGLGFETLQTGASTTLGSGSVANGMTGFWAAFVTDNPSGCGLIGVGLDAVKDWTMGGRAKVAASANQVIILGSKPSANYTDENGIIGFRISGTGNIFGVCDSAGSETTRDAGVTGATEFTWRIECRGNGTIVRFYINNAQVGTDVTTNIPTAITYAAVGISTTGVSGLNLFFADTYVHRE